LRSINAIDLRKAPGSPQRRGGRREEIFSLAIEGLAREKHSSPFGVRIIMDINELSSKIIGAAIEVHKALGPGLLESVYEECICHELSLRGLSFERQKPLSIEYKGKKLDCGYRLDIVAESKK